jgi:hypothetical protein
VVHRIPNLHKNLKNGKIPACFPEQAKDCGEKERRNTQEGEIRIKGINGMGEFCQNRCREYKETNTERNTETT